MRDEALPRSLRRIAELTSLEVALKLMEEVGGTAMYVPKTPVASSRLSRVIGVGAARALSRQYGGSTMSVPLATTSERSRRYIRVHQLLDEGRSLKEVARCAGLSTRTIIRIKKRRRAAVAAESCTEEAGPRSDT